MTRANSEHYLKSQRWSLTAALVAVLLSQQSVGAHGLGNVVGAGPLANRLDGQHRALQTYTSSATVQSLLLEAVNAERVKAGLAAVCGNSKLQVAAQLHSQDQATNNFMSHTGSDDSTMSQRIDAQGFKWSALGENVAAGYSTVSSVMAGWMNSKGHQANILNANYTFFGGGYAYNAASTYRHYWTQDFGAGFTEACDSTTAATLTPTPTPTSATQTTTPTPTPRPTTPTPTTATPIPTSVSTTVTPTPTPTPALTSTRSGKGKKSAKQSRTESAEQVMLNGICGNDVDGPSVCVAGAYCQPWNAEIYECIAVPEGSGTPEVNVDYFGDDIDEVRGVNPHECADTCIKLSGCAAYTFVNTNDDGQTTCYLKSGTGTRTEKIGAVSAAIAG